MRTSRGASAQSFPRFPFARACMLRCPLLCSFPLVMFLLYTPLLTIAILFYDFLESFLQRLDEGQLVSIYRLATGIGLDPFCDNTLCEVSLDLLEWLMI